MGCPSCLVAVSGTEGLGESGVVCSTGTKFTVLGFGVVMGVLAALWFDASRVRAAQHEAGNAYTRGWASGARARRPRR